MRELDIPFAGLFGACSTMAEALGLGAAFCAGGMAEGVLAMASSHFCAAEREFRTPLNYGAFRTPTSQWTATAAGCCLLRPAGPGVQIRAVTLGRVVDYRVSDITNMGAAMAPRRCRHPAALSGRHPHPALQPGLHLHRGPGPGGQPAAGRNPGRGRGHRLPS